MTEMMIGGTPPVTSTCDLRRHGGFQRAARDQCDRAARAQRLLAGRDLHAFSLVDHDEPGRQGALRADQIEAGVERDLAGKRDQQILDADVERKVLALVGVV